MSNAVPSTSVCTPPVLSVIERLVNRVARHSPGDMNIAALRGAREGGGEEEEEEEERGGGLKVHELSIDSGSFFFLFSFLNRPICADDSRVKSTRLSSEVRQVSHKTPSCQWLLVFLALAQIKIRSVFKKAPTHLTKPYDDTFPSFILYVFCQAPLRPEENTFRPVHGPRCVEPFFFESRLVDF